MDKRADTELNLSFLKHYLLEDEIFMRIEKLEALCTVQIMLDASDTAPASQIRMYYSMVIEEQVTEMRSLLNQLYS
ncbi:MAG TPA: hypothetical protein VN030_07970 [Cellvibrio sp.]|nr:hypothetical protein [Cellvibrio sp.]